MDTSKIRWSKSGDYRIYYTAKDSDNNQSKAWATVRVIVPGSAESAADQVLRSITKSGWSDEKKARAIYRYVTRYPVPGGQRHFWNLTYVRGGWYHFDTTPRTRKGTFCLMTDAQLHEYSSGYTFSFNRKLYPKRAGKRIS